MVPGARKVVARCGDCIKALRFATSAAWAATAPLRSSLAAAATAAAPDGCRFPAAKLASLVACSAIMAYHCSSALVRAKAGFAARADAPPTPPAAVAALAAATFGAAAAASVAVGRNHFPPVLGAVRLAAATASDAAAERGPPADVAGAFSP
jgi:hypothetical protein